MLRWVGVLSRASQNTKRAAVWVGVRCYSLVRCYLSGQHGKNMRGRFGGFLKAHLNKSAVV
jgi:hypothetical protein